MLGAIALVILAALGCLFGWFVVTPGLRHLWHGARQRRHVRYPVPIALHLSQGDHHGRRFPNDHR